MATGGTLGKRSNRNYLSKHIYANSKYREKLFDFINLETNNKHKTQYLYADPTFSRQAINKDYQRQEGGCAQQEIYYDCHPCEFERDDPGILQQQLTIFEVINEIKNPKEFKGLLKQIAYTSIVLYRTFYQAYSKMKRCKKKKEKKFCMTSANQLDQGNINPWEIINIEVPTSKHAYLEDIRCEPPATEKEINHKYTDDNKCFKQEKCFCFMCTSGREFEDKGEQKICPICLGFIERESNICCENCNQEPLKTEKAKYFDYKIENIGDEMESNIFQNFGEDQKHLIFCESCAVLRSDTVLHTNGEEEPQVIENLAATIEDVNNSKPLASTITPNDSNQTQTTFKQVLNLRPQCVNIPLTLRIECQNCQSRCIETEMQMKRFDSSHRKSLTCIQKHGDVQEPTISNSPFIKLAEYSCKVAKSDKLEEKSDSDIFYSCISNSGIIISPETQNTCNDNALNEILEMMKKHMPSFKEALVEKEMQSTSIKLSTTEIPAIPISKNPSSRINFTQTVETVPPTAALSATVPSAHFDPETKGKQLRAELLKEIRAALYNTPTKDAIKALQEGKQFSLPLTLRQKEITNDRPAKHSTPSNSQATPTRADFLKPLAPLPIRAMAGFNPEASRRPDLPPKPAIAPKPALFATDAVQTISSTLRPSRGHIKRNKIRNTIQEELKELLEENPTTSKAKFKPEEKDKVLLDIHKLFHPEKSGMLSKQICLQNALQDIRYLLETEDQKPDTITSPSTAQNSKTSESNESILQSMKSILNPKSAQKSITKNKFSKDTKKKILQDFHMVLTPRWEKQLENREIRSSDLENLRFLLKTGQETTASQSQALHNLMATDTGPGYSGAQQVRQARQQKPSHEIIDSVIYDLKFLLDYTHPNQASNSLAENLLATRQAAQKETTNRNKTVSSDESSDNE